MKQSIIPQPPATNGQSSRPYFEMSALSRRVAMVLLIFGMADSVLAANKFWGGPAGSAASPVNGIWDTTSANWATTSSGASTTTFATSDAANFGGLDGIFIQCSTLTTGSITNNNSYTFTNITPVTVSMAAATPWMIAPGKTVTIGTNVTFAYNTASGGTINVNNPAFGGTIIVGNGGVLQQTGNQSMQFDGSGTLIRVLAGGLLQHTGSGSNVRIPASTGDSAILSIEGGTVQVTGAAGFLIANSAGSAGTITITSGLLNVTNNPVTLGVNNAATCIATNNLNGGTELVRQIKTGGALTISIFNFNGGTLKAGSSALASTFMTGLTTANVRNVASTIDNGGYSIGIGQALLHSTVSGDNATDGGLIFTGAGVTTNSGVNTYNGPTVVSAGTLVTTTASKGAGAYSVSNSATLNVQVNAAGTSLTNSSLALGTSSGDVLTNVFALGANASTTLPAVTVNGALSLNGTVSVNVSATGLTGPNTYLLMSYGSINGSGNFVPVALPSVGGYIGTLTNDTSAKQLKLIYTQAPQPVKWAVGNGNWDTTTLNWDLLSGAGPTNYVEGALAAFDDSSTGTSPITITLTGVHSPNMVSNNAAKEYILAGGFGLNGPAFVKNGSGTFVVDNSGPNSFSSVVVSGGALQLGNNDSGGDLGLGTITNNATLVFNRTDNPTVANIIAGSGSLAQNGSGSVTLTGASTFNNISAINNGQLILGNSGALQNSTVSNNLPGGLGFTGITAATLGGLAGTGDITMLNDSSSLVALTVGGNNQPTVYSGSLNGGANLLKAGTNVLVLSGNSTLNSVQLTGPGTLIITNGTVTIANLQLVTDNATLQINNANTTVTTDSRIAGANGVYGINGGTLMLPKLVIGSAAAANTNNLVTVSGNAQVYQNQTGGSQSPVDALWIGGNNSGSGGLLLKDNASWNNASAAANIVVIGNNGTGQGFLTIQDNATFFNATAIRVADLAGNVGTVNLNGGVCLVNGFSKGAGLGTINVNGGQVQALTATANFFTGFTATSGTNAVNLVSGKLTFDNGGFGVTVNNVLSGSGGLASQGGGSLTLTASNTYTGNTIISAGSLVLTGAGSINSSSSVSNSTSATLDVSAANAQLAIGGTFTLNNSTLSLSLASTNVSVRTFGTTVGSANVINVTALPAVASLPADIRVIKYVTAAPGLVDGGNNLTGLSVTLPAVGSPMGYLTNNAVAGSIDLIVTNMVLIPVIASQPLPDSAYGGGKAHFSAGLEVTNSPGLQYHWRKAGVLLSDGSNVSGSASPTVHLSNIAPGDAVNYDVVMANTSGSVTSSPAMLTFLTPSNYEATAVAAKPVALYMFQETGDPSTNTTAYDYEGDLDGIYGVAAQNGFNSVAGPTPADGFPGFDSATLAAHFQGFVSNSDAVIPPLNLNTNTVTLAAWIEPASPPANAGIIFCRGSGTTAGLNFTASTDINNFRTLGYTWNNDAGTYGWNSQIAPPPGMWSYVALVVTPTNATIYIMNANGLLSASNPFTHVNQGFSANTTIGEDNISTGNREFDGSVYGAAIYPTALSQLQLANMYGAASGVSNFPPVISVQPNSTNLYAVQNATFSSLVGGSQPLVYQWQWFDGANYFNITDGGRISGSATASLVISNLALSDATNFVLVVTNSFGSVTSSVATLTVNPVGPAANITNSTVLASGQDWNTGSAWSDGQSASISAPSEPGSIYYIVPGGGLRTPNAGSVAQFPGNVLNVLGDGNETSTLPAANIGALILKGTGSGYADLVMNGGEILDFTDNNGTHTIAGGQMNVLLNTPIAGLSSTGGRSIIITSQLTGNGSMEYQGWPNATFQTTAVTDLNIAGTNNTFNGAWSVDSGTLVGSTPGALGTNSITVSANAALQTTYDLNDTNATLNLNGRLNLTQNDTFRNVVVNGNTLAGGTYLFPALAAAYPANFPTNWTGLTGVETLTNGAGSLTVLGSIASNPTNITFSVSGTTLTLAWPADHLGWIAQSNSVGLLNTNWFDVPNSQTGTQINVSLNPALTNVFYRLRHP
jgi:autotransporter-associated beta strand protein